MAALKGADTDRFVRSPDPNALLILVYGPDLGLVSERARLIVKALSGGTDDPFSVSELDSATIAGTPGRLVDEAGTLSPFGGHRIVHVRRGDGALGAAAKALLDSDLHDVSVIIEEGDLKRDAAVRKLSEKHPRAIAVPCYADTEASVANLIDQHLKNEGLEIDSDARRALVDLLGGDRLASRNELDKLSLYAFGTGRIGLDDVQAISGDAAGLELDGFLDAVGLGDVSEADVQLHRLLQSGISIVALFSALQRHFTQLRVIRSAIDAGQTAEAAMKSLRPPIFFRREKNVRQQSLRWPLASLDKARDSLFTADLDARKSQALADAILGRSVLSLAVEARRFARGSNR